jgi:hypothetical protein
MKPLSNEELGIIRSIDPFDNVCGCGYNNVKEIERLLEHIDYLQITLDKIKEDDTIEDGFGSIWSAWCCMCNTRNMVVVRPGKVQCNVCG